MWGKNSIRRDKIPYVGKSFHTLETMEKMMTLEEKIRDLETQLENEKFFSRQDIMEVRGKNYVLLKECLQLLSDALDALEIIQENPEKFDDNLSGFLSTAIERIKSVMQDIEKNCKAHLERIDLNK